MKIDILTLFPESVMGVLGGSILGRAEKKGVIDIRAVQIRDYTENKQQQVDDYPYGGGWGCVMMAQPLKSCLDDVMKDAQGMRSRVIYMSPQGKTFNQTEARRLVRDYDHLVLVCGHYEGVDERFIEECCDEEISIGDFVLTGGEIASMAVADSVCRMVDGVLSDPECYEGESHWEGLLEYPQYTRPEVWEGHSVPPVLLTGNHADIVAWRREQQLIRTKNKRPELYEAFTPENDFDIKICQRLDGTEPLQYEYRRANESDIPALLTIAAQSSARMAAQGINQWQDNYPNEECFHQDIQTGSCWIFEHEGEAAGTISFFSSPQDIESYNKLLGEWLTNSNSYGEIHRCCVGDDYVGKGLGHEMMAFAEDILIGMGCASIRVDTHRDNKAMQLLLWKLNYVPCGVIYLLNSVEKDNRRLAYEKKLY